MSDNQYGEYTHGFASEPMFEPKKDPEPIVENDDRASIQEVANHLSEKWKSEGRSADSEAPMIDRGYKKPDGSPVEPDKIVTLKENAEALGKAYERDSEQLQQQADSELVNAIDQARLENAYQSDPAFREQYDAAHQAQQAQAEATANHQGQEQPDPQQPADPTDELTAAWQNADPKLKAALTAQVEQVQAAQQQYLSATMGQAQFVARAVFHDFPELVGKSPEQIDGIVAAYSRTNPERAAQIQLRTHEAVSVAKAAQEAMAQQAQQQAQLHSQQFKQFVDSEDKKFMDKHPELADAKSRMEIGEAAMRTLEAAGVSKEDLARSYFRGDGFSLRSAAAQEIILKAALYDQAKAGVANSTPKSAPPVQKPGSWNKGFSNGGDETIAALERRVAKTGSLKDATALRLAKMRRG